MTTTAIDWRGLADDVGIAAEALRRSEVVPPEVEQLVDGLGDRLSADRPMHLIADPYLTTSLFAAAYMAEKALRHDDERLRRRDLRVALERVRRALRDIDSNRPFSPEVPVRDVLAATVDALSASQGDLAALLRVSVRQLQRWLADDGVQPAGNDEARVRIVGQTVNQLRHVFTGPGVLAWFGRTHPTLHEPPAVLLADPVRYPELLAAATGARSMTG
ncbi:hypothetical protein K6U06_15605 [Acidiferrimicrobium sp. IK]|uniref:hypothetical protein n=1 Tax=Acidiferrimicrobium sp. IK TaxID=2871700 RepID=UPI0021CAFD94|nr:hypothetical protein [Acidiferrimicrobium sp. IK]MCU4185795.1 hypothetical protein [Acidiferrimicrobium sp. IK]